MSSECSSASFFSNVARQAFDNVQVWSRICKVPEDLLRDYGFLLKALRCGYAINADAYQALADDWLFRWHADGRVNWSRLNPSCHIVTVCNRFTISIPMKKSEKEI